MNISHISLDRWFGFENNTDVRIELNIELNRVKYFCDASPQAYGAVTYFFISKIYTVFVLSMPRLSPLKEQCSITNPKLELQAAVLAVRLKYTILEEIEFDSHKIRFWADQYIRILFKKFSVYIMSRLLEIKLNSKVDEWSFIPGKNNPADQCTGANLSLV